MKNSNPNKRERYIVLHADKFFPGVWEKYCDAMGFSADINEIRVNFDSSDVIELDDLER